MTARTYLCFSVVLFTSALFADVPAAECATLIVEGWKHRVWSIYPVEKLKADDVLPAEPKAEGVTLTAARGETEPFILVLRSDVPLREVTVHPDAFRNSDGKRSDGIAAEVARLGYVHVDEPSGSRIKAPMPYATGTGDFPDPLLEGACDARPGRNTQLLVSVTVSRDAQPGRHTCVLSLRFRHEGWMPNGMPSDMCIPLTVTVRPFALPAVSPLFNTAVASPHALPDWLNRPEVLTDLRRTFVAHGQTPDPLPSPVVRREKDGTLAVDSTEWEKAAAALLDGGLASHVFLPVWSGRKDAALQGVYFLWHYPAVTKQRWFGATICDGDGSLTPEFQALFGAYLKHMHALLVRRGWLGKVFITTMDEPYTYHLHDEDRAQDTPENNYRVIGHYVRFVRATAPGLLTFATADPAPGLNGLIDLWCLRNLSRAAEARERAMSYGERVVFCDNYRTFIDYPAVSARSLGWLAWKLGASGWLTFETLGDLTTAWEGPVFTYPHFSGGTVWGMGQLFYPDPRGAGGLAPSLRWELMREGCDDYAYLWLLQDRVRHLPAAQRESADAQEAQTLLNTAASAVVGGSGDIETVSSAAVPNAQSNRTPHELRRRLGDLIERLTLGEKQP